MSERTCILKNLGKGEAKGLPDIVIQGSAKKIIGRSAETAIESSSISREHCKATTECFILFAFI